MRLFRNYPVIIVVSCLLLAGCASSSGPIDPYVQKLQWLDAADPQADAQQAVKKQDYRLLGIAGRTVNIPGISKEESLDYDSNEHLRLMQKARSYALKYNAIIKTHCQP
jgi:hypothetical protein